MEILKLILLNALLTAAHTTQSSLTPAGLKWIYGAIIPSTHLQEWVINRILELSNENRSTSPV